MNTQTILLLASAGVLGGAANAMAGGATLITFPAMLAAGLPPITANASNAASVIFGNLMGVASERKQLPTHQSNWTKDIIAAIVGGALGGILLLATPDKYFQAAIPLLIGVATIIFAFSKTIQTKIKSWLGGTDGTLLRAAMVFLAAIYGGYFGAGLGVILMAAISATTTLELRPANAIKNLLGVSANLAAIAWFLWQSVISFPETGVMIVGCIAGGLIGGKLLQTIPSATVRKTIIIIGAIMTVVYAFKYWM
jgi:uncharacterized membrane protein YfcA